jgi:hypothetical protein
MQGLAFKQVAALANGLHWELNVRLRPAATPYTR